jgi:hypothetical protein
MQTVHHHLRSDECGFQSVVVSHRVILAGHSAWVLTFREVPTGPRGVVDGVCR